MRINIITEDREKYMDILLLADPQEDMIFKYLHQSDLFVLSEEGVIKTVCAVVRLNDRACEIKNIATIEDERGKGYGTHMIHYVCEHYSSRFQTIFVGTGNSKNTVGFYEKCGFSVSHIVTDFFVDHYREPIYEEGKQLMDMIYLKKKLQSDIDVKKVADVALEAGRILLKNGGEIFRVEETMTRICQRFHVEKVEIFALSHGIFFSVQNGEEVYTKVKNIPLSSTNLTAVAEVNALSRDISSGKVTIEEAEAKLEEIDQMPVAKNYYQILGAGLGSGGFGFILGATPLESLAAVGIGCLLYMWVLLAKKLNMSKIVLNLVGGIIITVLAIIIQQLAPAGTLHMNGMIVGSIMPLIPGLPFVNAIREIADNDFLSGTVRMIDALLVFVYIAVGVGITFSVYHNLLGGLML